MIKWVVEKFANKCTYGYGLGVNKVGGEPSDLKFKLQAKAKILDKFLTSFRALMNRVTEFALFILVA